MTEVSTSTWSNLSVGHLRWTEWREIGRPYPDGSQIQHTEGETDAALDPVRPLSDNLRAAAAA